MDALLEMGFGNQRIDQRVSVFQVNQTHTLRSFAIGFGYP